MALLGAHMPAAGGVGNALRRGKEIGCEAVQVFTASPRMWKARPLDPSTVADFRRAQEETGIAVVVSHDSYLVNLCAPDPEIQTKSYDSLRGEILRCAELGISHVVSHIGAAKEQDEEDAIRIAAERMRALLSETPESVNLLMETTAGQGSSLNHRFEQLARFLDLLQGHPRVGVCLDTCHIFAAGYDIRDAEGYDLVVRGFDRLVGLDRLEAIHVNDSQKPLGSHRDRHAHIGEGEIGETAFRLLVNDVRFTATPMLLETNDAETMHAVNLARLKSYREVT